MKQLLRTGHLEGQSWFDVLQHVEMAINPAALPNSKISPFCLNYGFHPCFEADVFSM